MLFKEEFLINIYNFINITCLLYIYTRKSFIVNSLVPLFKLIVILNNKLCLSYLLIGGVTGFGLVDASSYIKFNKNHFNVNPDPWLNSPSFLLSFSLYQQKLLKPSYIMVLDN